VARRSKGRKHSRLPNDSGASDCAAVAAAHGDGAQAAAAAQESEGEGEDDEQAVLTASV
jgi:hypothetical protein